MGVERREMERTMKVASRIFFDINHKIVDEKDAVFVEIHYDDGSVAFAVHESRATID
jgi:hypothetical protein